MLLSGERVGEQNLLFRRQTLQAMFLLIDKQNNTISNLESSGLRLEALSKISSEQELCTQWFYSMVLLWINMHSGKV